MGNATKTSSIETALTAVAAFHAAASAQTQAWAGDAEAGYARYAARSLAPAEAKAVAAAIEALPWGRQAHGYFVTDQSTDWSGGRSKALWGPGKVLIAAVESSGFGDYERREVFVPRPAAARAAAAAAAVSRRKAQAEYDADLTSAARALRGAGIESLSDGARVGPWVHYSGQNGGRLVRVDADGWPRNVSARGALKRAWGEGVEITLAGGARVIGAPSRAELAAAGFEARFERLDGARY